MDGSWWLGLFLFGGLGVVVILVEVISGRKQRQLRKRADQARADWERTTVICPTCLGTGRSPRPGREWCEEDVAEFKARSERERIEREVPEAVRKAFKED